MKFLKTQNTSRFGLKDNAFKVNPYGRYTMDGTGGLRLPKGRGPFLADGVTPDPAGPDQRPNLSGVEMPDGANGMLRYNTTLNELECYIGGFWETVKGSATNSITASGYGPGDFVETKFGPLNTAYAPDYTANANNIIVLVENVWQIAGTNFTIVTTPAGVPSASFYGGAGSYPAGYYISFSEAVPIGKTVTVYYGYAN
jgi:hypothetical protein